MDNAGDYLFENLNRIHTTPMGAERIVRNLKLETVRTSDAVIWCKERIQRADRIVRKGKNWYVYVENAKITVNANSFTIITAHRID